MPKKNKKSTHTHQPSSQIACGPFVDHKPFVFRLENTDASVLRNHARIGAPVRLDASTSPISVVTANLVVLGTVPNSVDGFLRSDRRSQGSIHFVNPDSNVCEVVLQ
ncbi:MAG: hypothetical protein EON58_07475 [Alphaproteobacteria bacterium]|nr:MAG: hypothetical protein EON58_07475 [Alphaproteobacteria bacterium]